MADELKYPTRIAPYGLRMPPDLKDRVQAAAEANNRSMNAEIVATLERAYPAAGKDPDSDFAELIRTLRQTLSQAELIKIALGMGGRGDDG